jgi:trigger factor
VKEIKANVLPDLDDAFAKEASEFDTLDDLREDIRSNLVTLKASQAQRALYEKTTEALAELVEDEPPEALVTTQIQQQLQDLAMSLGAQGLELEQYMAMSGQSQEEMTESLRESAIPAVKIDLAIRAIAESEAIEIDDDAIEAELTAVADQLKRPIEEILRDFESAGQISAVRSDLRKRAALEWLVSHVDIVDDEGQPIDPNDLEIADPEGDADPDEEDDE